MKLFRFFLGETSIRRQANFLFGLGILVVVTSFTAFSTMQMEGAVLMRMRADGSPSLRQDLGKQAAPILDSRFKQARASRRANMITAALVVSMADMAYMNVVMRHLVGRPRGR